MIRKFKIFENIIEVVNSGEIVIDKKNSTKIVIDDYSFEDNMFWVFDINIKQHNVLTIDNNESIKIFTEEIENFKIKIQANKYNL